MQPTHDTLDAYCALCLAPAPEDAAACATCRIPFVGSGAFHIVRGPRPSPLFAELFSSAHLAPAGR